MRRVIYIFFSLRLYYNLKIFLLCFFLLESWFPLYNVYSVFWGIADLKKHTILLKGYIVNKFKKKTNLELHTEW